MGELKDKVKSFFLRYGIAFAVGFALSALLAYLCFIAPLRGIHAKDLERANKLQLDVDSYRKSNDELTKLLEEARGAADSAVGGIESAIGSIGDGQRGVAESQDRVRRLQDGSAGDIGLAQEIARQAEEALQGLRDIQKRLGESDK